MTLQEFLMMTPEQRNALTELCDSPVGGLLSGRMTISRDNIEEFCLALIECQNLKWLCFHGSWFTNLTSDQLEIFFTSLAMLKNLPKIIFHDTHFKFNSAIFTGLSKWDKLPQLHFTLSNEHSFEYVLSCVSGICTKLQYLTLTISPEVFTTSMYYWNGFSSLAKCKNLQKLDLFPTTNTAFDGTLLIKPKAKALETLFNYISTFETLQELDISGRWLSVVDLNLLITLIDKLSCCKNLRTIYISQFENESWFNKLKLDQHVKLAESLSKFNNLENFVLRGKMNDNDSLKNPHANSLPEFIAAIAKTPITYYKNYLTKDSPITQWRNNMEILNFTQHETSHETSTLHYLGCTLYEIADLLVPELEEGTPGRLRRDSFF